MKIRTRYKLFKLIILVGAVIFLATLYDMFLNTSQWKPYMFIGYGVMALLALVLYLGYKPNLDEPAPEPAPEPVAEAEPVVIAEPEPAPPVMAEPQEEILEVPRARIDLSNTRLQGPYQFQCPSCRHIFGVENLHDRQLDFRIHCPYCAKSIKVPRRPLITRKRLVDLADAAPEERAIHTCANCGEILRITAPNSQLERLLKVETCPRCQSTQIKRVAARYGSSA